MCNDTTSVKSNCPDCGGVTLAATEVRLVMCTVEAWSFYEFRCPQCCELVKWYASDEVIKLLANIVLAERWHVPAEAVELHVGPPLTWDDLLDFKLQLAAYSHVIVEAAAGSLKVA